jgi:hypothetical protein
MPPRLADGRSDCWLGSLQLLRPALVAALRTPESKPPRPQSFDAIDQILGHRLPIGPRLKFEDRDLRRRCLDGQAVIAHGHEPSMATMVGVPEL